jgi:hypothetical protein
LIIWLLYVQKNGCTFTGRQTINHRAVLKNRKVNNTAVVYIDAKKGIKKPSLKGRSF